MKKLLLALAFTLCHSAFAISVDDFCEQFTWDSEKINCLKTAGRNYIEFNALDICANVQWDSDKMTCLNSILNKSYTPGEVRTCANQSWESDKLKCLVQLGSRYNPPGDARLDSIRKLTIVAQDYLRRNDIFNAQRALDQILSMTIK